MAVYVYNVATGALVSWCPGDTDPVASADVLTANGLASVSGLAALDVTHAWDAATRSVVVVTAPVPPQLIQTGVWILRFTPTEFKAIMASTDPVVQQFLYALNHTTQIDLTLSQITNGVAYLITAGLLQSSRQAAILAVPASIYGP